jgi:hypothetical protein
MKKSAQIILENTEGFDKEKYRLGHTKVNPSIIPF